MRYEGPEALRRPIVAAWNRVAQNTTRKDEPLIVVGGIGVIASNGKGIRIEGDYLKNEGIDELWRSLRWYPREIPETLRELVELCKAADIQDLRGTVPIVGLYNTSLDVAVFSAEATAIYIGGDITHVKPGERLKFSIIPEQYEHECVKVMIRREFGDTAYARELQRALAEKKPKFNKAEQGQYSFQKLRGNGNGSLRPDIIESIKMLGILELEAATATIGAERLHAERIAPDPGDSDAMKVLYAKAQQSTPQQFIQFGKDVAEQAYAEKKHAKEIILRMK